jgi:hypothetical protein
MSSDKKTSKLAASNEHETLLAQVEAETRDEIEDIMNEIQQLQKNMDEAPKAKGKPQPKLKVVEESTSETALVVAAQETGEAEADLADFRGNESDASMEETLAAMKAEETGHGLLDEPATAEQESQFSDERTEEEFEMKKNGTAEAGEGCMSMSLQGSMTMKMKYEYEGQEVAISFVDGCLCVELSDGTEFKIPVARGGQSSKAA